MNVVRYINDNGGFTVIGWYKKGSINDISTEESDNQVESSEMGYHIVSITPTNKTFWKRKNTRNCVLILVILLHEVCNYIYICE